MDELKKTPAKKPAAKKKPAQANAEIKSEEQLEVAAVQEPAEKPAQPAKKPAAKKKPAQAKEKSKAEEQSEVAAATSEPDTSVAEQPEQEPAPTDEQKSEAAETEATAAVTETAEAEAEAPAAEDQKPEEHKSEEQPKDDPQTDGSESKASAEHSKKASKKHVLNKKTTIILSCVLAVVIIAVVIILCVVSCNGGAATMYTVTFDTLGGTSVSSYKLAAGSKINRPSKVPTKEMFTFDDWYIEVTNSQGKKERQKFVFGTTISQNITLYAGWKGEVSVKVEFDPNGGKFEDGNLVDYVLVGSKVTEPEQEPTRFGYVFDGWYTNAECSAKYQFSSSLDKDTTLYAGWAESDDYAYISYYGNGKLLQVVPVAKDENIEIPELFKPKDEIITTGWYTDSALSKPYTAGKATESISLYTTYYTSGLVIKNATVTDYTGDATDVVIPSTYNGKTVTSIGAEAFFCRPELPVQITSVTLPATINFIGDRAFYNCQYLANINLTDNVAWLGTDAFYRNIRLRTVGDMSGVTYLGAGAFNGCYMLGEVNLNDGITSIGAYTFNDCKLLTSVSVPARVMSIGDYAFSGCTSLKSVVMEMVVNTVGKFAFAGCTNLTEVTIKREIGTVSFDPDGNPFASCRNVTVYVPSELVDTYKENPDNDSFKDKIAAIR